MKSIQCINKLKTKNEHYFKDVENLIKHMLNFHIQIYIDDNKNHWNYEMPISK